MHVSQPFHSTAQKSEQQVEQMLSLHHIAVTLAQGWWRRGGWQWRPDRDMPAG